MLRKEFCDDVVAGKPIDSAAARDENNAGMFPGANWLQDLTREHCALDWNLEIFSRVNLTLPGNGSVATCPQVAVRGIAREGDRSGGGSRQRQAWPSHESILRNLVKISAPARLFLQVGQDFISSVGAGSDGDVLAGCRDVGSFKRPVGGWIVRCSPQLRRASAGSHLICRDKAASLLRTSRRSRFAWSQSPRSRMMPRWLP